MIKSIYILACAYVFKIEFRKTEGLKGKKRIPLKYYLSNLTRRLTRFCYITESIFAHLFVSKTFFNSFLPKRSHLNPSIKYQMLLCLRG